MHDILIFLQLLPVCVGYRSQINILVYHWTLSFTLVCLQMTQVHITDPHKMAIMAKIEESKKCYNNSMWYNALIVWNHQKEHT